MRSMYSPSASHVFLFRHVWLPLLAFALAALILESSSFDLWLADRWYGLEGTTWSWRDAWLTSSLIHDAGRRCVALLGLVLLIAAPASLYVTRLRRLQRGLWYLLGSVLVSGLVINVLKHVTHVDCPWDLLRYGGELPYVHNFAPHPGSYAYGACFPAGHASAAYSWLGAYYVAREYAPRWKRRVLLAVIGMGLLFGFSQQLRGAHFISHDLWTLGICWGLATALYRFAFRSRPRQERHSENWCPGQESNLRPAP
jgi:membrane-associated PAP2 superfamily phosphatase